MASVKLSAVVTAIKGKVGGSVFQGSRVGTTLKNNRISKKKSGAIVLQNEGEIMRAISNNFGQVTKYWSQISEADRNSWSALVGVWTFLNKFGDVYNATAFQIFTACNRNSLTFNNTLMAVAPIKIDAVFPVFTLSNYSVSGTFDLTVVNAITVPQFMVISATFQNNATRSPKNIPKKIITVQDVNGQPTIDLKPFYIQRIGRNPQTGGTIHLSIWTAKNTYPKKQFIQEFIVDVVA